jgi:hypothetical protein
MAPAQATGAVFYKPGDYRAQ